MSDAYWSWHCGQHPVVRVCLLRRVVVCGRGGMPHSLCREVLTAVLGHTCRHTHLLRHRHHTAVAIVTVQCTPRTHVKCRQAWRGYLVTRATGHPRAKGCGCSVVAVGAESTPHPPLQPSEPWRSQRTPLTRHMPKRNRHRPVHRRGLIGAVARAILGRHQTRRRSSHRSCTQLQAPSVWPCLRRRCHRRR